jgi:hypothetical protein
MGDADQGVALARKGLDLALSAQHAEAAGRGYYDLAVALIGAADYAASADAFSAGVDLCREHRVNEMGQACVACMAVAVRLLGDWDRALAIARTVLDDAAAPELFRMVAQEETALITVLRGNRRSFRARLREAADFGRQAGVFGIEVGATWGIAVAAELDADPDFADRVAGGLLTRCQDVEDWTFALPALRWTATFLATRGEGDDLDPDSVLGVAVEGQVPQAGVLQTADAVLAAGALPVADLEDGQGPAGSVGVGGEAGDPPAVVVGQPQLGTRMRTLAAGNDPHPLGPVLRAEARRRPGRFGRGWDPGGQFGDLSPVTGFAVAVDRRPPGLLGDRLDRGLYSFLG